MQETCQERNVVATKKTPVKRKTAPKPPAPKKINGLPWPIVLGMAALIGLAGIVAATKGVTLRLDDRKPPAPPVVLSELETACDEYASLLKAHIEDTRARLQAGTITDERTTWTTLADGRKAALEAAFSPVAARDQEQMGGAKWTPKTAADRLGQLIGAK
jgi:hypothetical protein